MKTKQTVRETKEPRFQPMETAVAYVQTGAPPPDPFTDFLDAYSAHVWVYACVRAIAANVAGVRILPYVPKKTKDGISWVENPDHEFAKLLDFPNPYMSGYQLRQYTVAARKLMGNAYWYLEKFGKSEVQEIWPLIPDKVRPVASKEKLIDHYLYYVGGRPTRLEYNEVIHFKTMNPSSLIYGQGDLSAAKTTVITDIFAQVWNKSFFGNAARPDAVLETDSALDEDVRKRVMQSWKDMHSGPTKHGKTAVLEQGLKYSRVSESTKDMDFVNLRKDMRTEILAAFGVPPSVVGVLEYANYSNMEQQFKAFWTNTLLPEMRDIEETLTIRARQITFDFKTVFQADLSKVAALQPDMKMLSETTQIFVNSGVPINQVIDALDLPFQHVEGGDVPRASAGAPVDTTVVKQITPDPTPSTVEKKKIVSAVREAEWKVFDSFFRQHEGKFKSAMRGFFAGQKRRVIASLGTHSVLFTNELKRFSEIQLQDFGDHKDIQEMLTKSIEDSVRVIFNFDNEKDAMRKPTGRLIKGTYFDFAVRQAGKLGLDFNLNDPVALAWIKAKESKLVQEVTQFTLESLTDDVTDAVQEAIAAGFDAGETIASITDRIDAVYEFAVEGRSERIARTEVVSASNAGNMDALTKAGVSNKEWLSSRDEKVRETHDTLDGATVGIGEDFISSNGAHLSFPGDPSGPAEEIINCRCVVVGGKQNED